MLRDSTTRFVGPSVRLSVCPSVRRSVPPSVRPSVHPSVRNGFLKCAKTRSSEIGRGKAWGEEEVGVKRRAGEGWREGGGGADDGGGKHLTFGVTKLVSFLLKTCEEMS